MSQKPPTRAMRENPDIEQLKRQAKELFEAYRASSPKAVAEVTAYHQIATPDNFALHDAQFVLARSYGFESWPKLKAAVDGVTAAKLHTAAESGDLKTARELLTRRPEIVDLGRGEMRALHMAVLRRDLKMTELLLEFGADPDTGIWPIRDSTSPYAIARDRGYEEIAGAILTAREKRGARGPQGPSEAKVKLEQAYHSGSEEAIVAVFDEHPELAELCTPDGLTMLHRAAARGAPAIMKWLIDHGAGVDRRTGKFQQGWTPLDFAACGSSGEWLFDNEKFRRTAQFLIDQGAHLTPLSAAALGRWDYIEKCPKAELEDKGLLEAAVKGNQPDTLRRLLDLGLDPDERTQVGHVAEQSWSAGGPLFQAVVLNRTEMARMLLERGADPNAEVWCSGSATYRAYESRNPETIELVERYGGWIDAGSAGYARQTEIARRMLAGEIDPHITPNDSSGRTVADQLLWGGASAGSVDIVRMALEQVDWPPDDRRWFWKLFRPLHNIEDYNAEQQAECCECFKLILARCGPHHRDEYGRSMLHYVAANEVGAAVQFAAAMLDAGARLDVRDELLKSTPLGWACRWGRVEMVKLLLARGADPVEADAEPWATPRAWAEKMHRPEIMALLDRRAPRA
ncbi:MAG TPA: ankyrin repeat domain-containing protein [Bryobacteraceae bacterium]|jgi:ankyrin repeat protein